MRSGDPKSEECPRDMWPMCSRYNSARPICNTTSALSWALQEIMYESEDMALQEELIIGRGSDAGPYVII